MSSSAGTRQTIRQVKAAIFPKHFTKCNEPGSLSSLQTQKIDFSSCRSSHSFHFHISLLNIMRSAAPVLYGCSPPQLSLACRSVTQHMYFSPFLCNFLGVLKFTLHKHSSLPVILARQVQAQLTIIKCTSFASERCRTRKTCFTIFEKLYHNNFCFANFVSLIYL